jgi:hypothetical protein
MTMMTMVTMTRKTGLQVSPAFALSGEATELI